MFTIKIILLSISQHENGLYYLNNPVLNFYFIDYSLYSSSKPLFLK